MVFGYFRDMWSYLIGRNYPTPKLLKELRETKPKPKRTTALVKFRGRGHIHILRQPILRPIEENEKEAWIETHPSSSVCVRRLQIHEEF